jgi:uncharacterized membrane protein YsdA (DUF1294 family)
MLVPIAALVSAALACAAYLFGGWAADGVMGAFLAAMSLVTFALFGIDKARARAGERRIREADLLGASLLGGALGALFGMRRFRHKTRHARFRVLVPTFALLHVALVVALGSL